MRYLVHFVASNPGFRIPELDALLTMAGIEPEKAYDHSLETLRRFEDTTQSPLLIVDLPSDKVARQVVQRSLTIKKIYDLWGNGPSLDALCKTLGEGNVHQCQGGDTKGSESCGRGNNNGDSASGTNGCVNNDIRCSSKGASEGDNNGDNGVKCGRASSDGKDSSGGCGSSSGSGSDGIGYDVLGDLEHVHEYTHSNRSWCIRVASIGAKCSAELQLALRNRMAFLKFKGPVQLKNPEYKLWIIEDRTRNDKKEANKDPTKVSKRQLKRARRQRRAALKRDFRKRQRKERKQKQKNARMDVETAGDSSVCAVNLTTNVVDGVKGAKRTCDNERTRKPTAIGTIGGSPMDTTSKALSGTVGGEETVDGREDEKGKVNKRRGEEGNKTSWKEQDEGQGKKQNRKKNEAMRPDLRAIYLCREVCDGGRSIVDRFSLKRRVYLGPTSMDPLLSFTMANMAMVRPGNLVLDPFVGTGSITISCAAFGAFCMGTDIDIRVLRGDGFNNGKNIKIVYGDGRTARGVGNNNVYDAFKQYVVSEGLNRRVFGCSCICHLLLPILLLVCVLFPYTSPMVFVGMVCLDQS